MMKDPLIKYLLNSKGYASVMKGVPLEYMENAKDLTSEVPVSYTHLRAHET